MISGKQAEPVSEHSVLVLTPTGRDANVMGELLSRERIAFVRCASIDELLQRARAGSGPIIVADEALTGPATQSLVELLNAQPQWSDLPVIILVGRRSRRARIAPLGTNRYAVVLERPIAVASLLTVLNSAMSARHRQYEVRDLLRNQHSLSARLEHRAGQLQRLTAEITDAENRERRRIADILHGDLQQTLVAIHIALGPLQDVADDQARSAVDRARRLVDQVGESCRALSHELSPPVLRYVGLAAAVEELVGEVQKVYGVTIDLTTGDMEDANETLRIFLFQALRELLFNVYKHAGVDRVSVDLRMEGDRLRLRVADQGRGFSSESLYVEGGRGGGFGLFSLHERLTHLGGKMEIRSAPGKGCCVTLYGPPSVRAPKPAHETRHGVEAAPLPERTSGCRILVADDHRLVREGLILMLERERDLCVIGEAENGKDAVQKARQLRPDIVLMDVSMPVMDGVEATRLLHGELPGIQVIGLSAFREEAIAQRMLDAGARMHLLKHQASDMLLNAIRSCRSAPVATA
jgi:signal transduction histidine kinase/ActR/RegA family two-component response regulator